MTTIPTVTTPAPEGGEDDGLAFPEPASRYVGRVYSDDAIASRDAELATLRAQLAEVTEDLVATRRNGRTIIDTYEATHARTMNELATLRGQRGKLAEAIANIATDAGILNHDATALSGPQFMMLAEDIGVTLRDQRAEVERMQATVGATSAYLTTVDIMGAFGTEAGNKLTALRAAIRALTITNVDRTPKK